MRFCFESVGYCLSAVTVENCITNHSTATVRVLRFCIDSGSADCVGEDLAPFVKGTGFLNEKYI